MLSKIILLCVVFVLAAWHEAQPAELPPFFRTARISEAVDGSDDEINIAPELPHIGEGVPIPLCAGRCASPPVGPVCAFDATGTARTFATLCELEEAWCHESTYYAITSLGEC